MGRGAEVRPAEEQFNREGARQAQESGQPQETWSPEETRRSSSRKVAGVLAITTTEKHPRITLCVITGRQRTRTHKELTCTRVRWAEERCCLRSVRSKSEERSLSGAEGLWLLQSFTAAVNASLGGATMSAGPDCLRHHILTGDKTDFMVLNDHVNIPRYFTEGDKKPSERFSV